MMTGFRTVRLVLAGLMLSAPCFAQNPPAQNVPDAPTPSGVPAPQPAPCPAADKTNSGSQPSAQKPCTPQPRAKDAPSPAQQFPFPGEQEKSVPAPNAPATAPGQTSPGDAAKDHPFPTEKPPLLPGGDDSGGAASGSSSSSSSGSSSSGTDDNSGTPDLPPGAEGTSVHRKLPKPVHVQTDDERVDEDINVAKFYMGDENYAGALLRAKDAVKVQPEYSLAHFTLAQVLQKMKKKDEAKVEFQTYLKMTPDGDKAHAAKEALSELK